MSAQWDVQNLADDKNSVTFWARLNEDVGLETHST